MRRLRMWDVVSGWELASCSFSVVNCQETAIAIEVDYFEFCVFGALFCW